MRICVFSYVRLFSESLTAFLSTCDEVSEVKACYQATQITEELLEFSPDIVLIDFTIDAAVNEAHAISNSLPGLPILGIGLSENAEKVIACADAGLVCYTTRQGSMRELLENILGALKGECLCSPSITASLLREVHRRQNRDNEHVYSEHLTPRESTILRLIGRGLSNKQIARELVLSVATVKNHVHNIFTKLNIHSRTEVLALMRNEPWITNTAFVN